MYHFLLVIQYISIALLLLESGYIFAKWRTTLQGYLFFNCVATLVNNVGYLMEMLSENEEQYLMALQMSYLGRVWIPFSLFVFIMILCKLRVNKWVMVCLANVHAVVFFLVLTAKWQPLYYSSMEYVTDGLFPYISAGHGIVHVLYTGLLVFYIVFGLIKLFLVVAKEKNPISRKRLTYVMLAITVESAGYIVNLTGITGCYDLTVMGYSIGTFLMCIAIFKYGLLDTLQLAKDYVVDEVSEGIIAVNNSNEVEYFNKTAKDILGEIGFESGRVIGKIQNAIDTETPLEIEGKIYSPKAQTLYQKDIPQGKVYVLVDETEHYRYMRELKEQKEIAEAANASKSAFLSIVSHEIRTPMNAVVGMTDLLLLDELTDKQRKYLTNIKNSGTALVMIINDILDQSKLEAGKMEIVEDAYELRPLVDDVRMIIENRIGKKNIHLMIKIDEKIPGFLVGDALRIRQIFINLMNNAVKFTESGYIQLSAAIVGETPKAYSIRFGVKDSGQGIKAEDLEKLGKAFAQVDTKKNHSKEGTGLGLSISKDFIALMGGELKVESTYGKGSEFYFVIEQKKAGTGGGSENGKCAWKPKEFKAPDAKILVVDDTRLNLMVMKEILGLLEIQVETADSGEMAIKMVQENRYHIIFMDYMMPGMDGVETTDRIRKLPGDYYKSVPIIALSGDTSERTQEMFEIAGINDIVEKPVEIERLKPLLLKWLPEELIM